MENKIGGYDMVGTMCDKCRQPMCICDFTQKEIKLNKKEYITKEQLDNFKLDRTMNDDIGITAITIRNLIKNNENLSDREIYRKLRYILSDFRDKSNNDKDRIIQLYKSKADNLDTIIKILKIK